MIRQILGWCLIISYGAVIYIAKDIDWTSIDNLIIWATMMVVGAIMTGGTK